MLLGDLEQPRVVLVAFPRRLRLKDTPQADAAVKGAGGVQHLEIECIEPLAYRGLVVLGIELIGKRDRRRRASGGNLGRTFRRPRPSGVRQPLVEVAPKNLGKSGRIGVFPVEDRFFQVLHPLAKVTDLLPLLQGFFNLVGVAGCGELVDLAEEPLDLRPTGIPVAIHGPVEFLFGPRFRFAGGRAEPLGHDTDHQGQGIPIFLQGLFGNQLLGPTHADGRVALPIDDFEVGIPDVGRMAVVFVEEFTHILPLLLDITRRGEKHVVGVGGARGERHGVIPYQGALVDHFRKFCRLSFRA